MAAIVCLCSTTSGLGKFGTEVAVTLRALPIILMSGKEGGSAEVEVFYRGARPAFLSSQNVINTLEPSRSLPYVRYDPSDPFSNWEVTFGSRT